MLYELGNRFKLQYDCYLVKKKPKLLDLTSIGASKTLNHFSAFILSNILNMNCNRNSTVWVLLNARKWICVLDTRELMF